MVAVRISLLVYPRPCSSKRIKKSNSSVQTQGGRQAEREVKGSTKITDGKVRVSQRKEAEERERDM